MATAHRAGAADGPPAGELHEWRGGGGRTVVSAALAYGAGPILFITTASVFIKPTMDATGWSTTQVLVAPWVTLLCSLLGPVVGRFIESNGVKRAVVVGLVPYAVVMVLFSVAPHHLPVYYLLVALTAFFGSFAFAVTYNRAVAPWFVKSAGKAFGLLGAGGAAMPLLGIPIVSWVVYTYGWQRAYLVLAAFALVVALPASLWGIRTKPVAPLTGEDHQVDADSQVRFRDLVPTLRTPAYWVLTLSITLAVAGATAFLANAQPLFLSNGLTVVQATSITTLFSVGVIIGRAGTGVLLDAFNRYAVTVVLLTVAAVAAFALTRTAVLPLVVVGVLALLVATIQGGEGDVGAYFLLVEYGRRTFAVLFGVTMAISSIGTLVGPLVFAAIVDAYGSYLIACVLGGALYVLAAVLMLVFRALRAREVRAAQAGAVD